LKDKIGGSFTASDTKVDGGDCVRMIDLALKVHHEMETLPRIIVTMDMVDVEIYEICQECGLNMAKKLLASIMRVPKINKKSEHTKGFLGFFNFSSSFLAVVFPVVFSLFNSLSSPDIPTTLPFQKQYPLFTVKQHTRF
jgi:hypothetical protein